MSQPRQEGASFTPARRARPRTTRPADAEELALQQADVDRGQTAALLGALGRMQLRLEVLSRQQPEGFERVITLLEGLDRRLASLEAAQAAGQHNPRPEPPRTEL